MTSVVTLKKIKLTGIQYGGLQFQFRHKTKLNGNKYGELKYQLRHWTEPRPKGHSIEQ